MKPKIINLDNASTSPHFPFFFFSNVKVGRGNQTPYLLLQDGDLAH